MNIQDNLRTHILDYFEFYESNYISDLYNYLLQVVNDYIDYDIFERELLKLSSEKIIKIKNNEVMIIQRKSQKPILYDINYSDYNFVIIAEILNPIEGNLKLSTIIRQIEEYKELFKKLSFLPEFTLQKTKNNKELLIEFIAEDWGGTILLQKLEKRDIIEICTLVKRTEFLIEWENYVENNFTPNDYIYRSLPTASHAMFLFNLMKSLITTANPSSKLRIECAEFRKSQ